MLKIKMSPCDLETAERKTKKIFFKGNSMDLLVDALDVTVVLLNDFLFRKPNIDKKTKFSMLDDFLNAVKNVCEQTICKVEGE